VNAPHQYYDDGLIQLDREAITLRRYHFPSGTAKVIPLREIRGYTASSLDVLHRIRLWGSSDLHRWLPLDIGRPLRSTLVTLELVGSYWRPAFTPADPEKFTRMLDELLHTP
jgi:hypothetical protein